MDNGLKETREEAKHSRLLFGCLCVLFCGLYVLRHILEVSISDYMIYAAALTVVLLCRPEECVAFVLAISTFSGAGLTGVFYTALLLCLILRFAGYLKTVKLPAVFLVGMCMMELLHRLAGSNNMTSTLIIYITSVLCLVVIQQYPYKKIDADLTVNTVIAFILFFAVISVYQVGLEVGSLEALMKESLRSDLYDTMVEDGAFLGNQNFLTSVCSLGLGLCLTMILNKRKKLPYVLAMAVFLFVGFLTISKMFVVIVAALSLLVVVALGKKNTLYGIGGVILVGAVLLLIDKMLGDSLLGMIEGRFEAEDLTTGRVGIVTKLFDYMDAHPITYLTGLSILGTYNYIGLAIHSSLFETIGGWGVPGLVLAIVYVWVLVRQSVREARQINKAVPLHNYLPLIIFLLYSLIGMLFSSGGALTQMMVCLYALQLKEK